MSVRPSVRLSLSVKLSYRGHIGWATSKDNIKLFEDTKSYTSSLANKIVVVVC